MESIGKFKNVLKIELLIGIIPVWVPPGIVMVSEAPVVPPVIAAGGAETMMGEFKTITIPPSAKLVTHGKPAFVPTVHGRCSPSGKE